MSIGGIPNPDELAATTVNPFRPGWWVGWQIGWWTGWWNPFDHIREIDPREVGRLTVIQGEFLALQAEMFARQAEAIQKMGQQIAEKGG
jgi:hypothetical protein